MTILWILAAVCILAVAANADEDYGVDAEFKKIICEKNSEEFGADVDKCNEVENQGVKDLYGGCKKEIMGEMMNSYNFFKAACSDHSIFRKADDCIDKNSAGKNIEYAAAADDCFDKVYEKYGIEDSDFKKKLLF